MALSSDMRQWLGEELFTLSNSFAPNTYVIHVCTTTSLTENTYSTITSNSLGSEPAGSISGGAGNTIADFWEWNSAGDADGDGTTGAITNSRDISVDIDTTGTAANWALVDSNQSKVICVGSFSVSYSVAAGTDDLRFNANSILIEID